MCDPDFFLNVIFSGKRFTTLFYDFMISLGCTQTCTLCTFCPDHSTTWRHSEFKLITQMMNQWKVRQHLEKKKSISCQSCNFVSYFCERTVECTLYSLYFPPAVAEKLVIIQQTVHGDTSVSYVGVVTQHSFHVKQFPWIRLFSVFSRLLLVCFSTWHSVETLLWRWIGVSL